MKNENGKEMDVMEYAELLRRYSLKELNDILDTLFVRTPDEHFYEKLDEHMLNTVRSDVYRGNSEYLEFDPTTLDIHSPEFLSWT